MRLRRRGSCTRCGSCCKTGDPFAPRTDRAARRQPCEYYRERDGVGECIARTLPELPAEVLQYLRIACFPYPERPEQLGDHPTCGYSFEPVTDGD
jgi:hypothetical protein